MIISFVIIRKILFINDELKICKTTTNSVFFFHDYTMLTRKALSLHASMPHSFGPPSIFPFSHSLPRHPYSSFYNYSLSERQITSYISRTYIDIVSWLLFALSRKVELLRYCTHHATKMAKLVRGGFDSTKTQSRLYAPDAYTYT